VWYYGNRNFANMFGIKKFRLFFIIGFKLYIVVIKDGCIGNFNFVTSLMLLASLNGLNFVSWIFSSPPW